MNRWTPDLATGNPAIDRDHRELIDIIDALKHAAAAGDEKARLSDALDSFRDHVVRHFPTEERAMEAMAFPGLSAHRQAHAVLTSLVLELVAKDATGSHVQYSEVDQLAQTLYRHILLDDKPFAAFLARR